MSQILKTNSNVVVVGHLVCSCSRIAHFKKTEKLVSLSEQDLVDCVPSCDGCDGGWPSVAIEYTINSTQKE